MMAAPLPAFFRRRENASFLMAAPFFAGEPLDDWKLQHYYYYYYYYYYHYY